MQLTMNANDSKKTVVNKTKWDNGEEALLLDLWEENISELRGTGKNFHTYERMAEALRASGMKVSGADIKFKVCNMFRKYLQEKGKIGPSGGMSSSWEHYQRIHNIIGAYRPFNLGAVMVENTDSSSMSSSDDTDTPRMKRKQTRNVNDFELKMELVQLGRERNALLKDLVECTKKMEENISSYVTSLQNEINNEKP